MSSSTSSDTTVTVIGAFADATAANAAVPRLHGSGVAPAAITVVGAGSPAAAAYDPPEAGFLWRLVLIVVFWSMVGAGVGVAMGLAFAAAGLPPGGWTGVGVHIAAWSIFAHLIVGMWAGYALLTRGESRQPVTTLASGRVLVRVTCDAGSAERVRGALRQGGALSVGVYAADGRSMTVDVASGGQ